MAKQLPSPQERRAKLQLIWGIICLTAPTALWIIVITLTAVANLVFSGAPTGDALFGEPTGAQIALNIFAFLLGGLAFLTWLPGIIVGIILLATRPRDAR